MAQYWQNVFLRVYFLSMALYIVLREIVHKAHKSALAHIAAVFDEKLKDS